MQPSQSSMKERLSEIVAQNYSNGVFYFEFVLAAKRRFIMHVLRACNGNQCRAARELGMHRNTLSRTIAELKLDAKEWNPRWQLRKHPPRLYSERQVERILAREA